MCPKSGTSVSNSNVFWNCFCSRISCSMYGTSVYGIDSILKNIENMVRMNFSKQVPTYFFSNLQMH